MNEATNNTEGMRRPQKAVPWLLFAVLFLTFAYFFHAQAGWNVNSRIALTYAMVERRTFRIDDYPVLKDGDALYTEDIAFKDGHYYSDKIIGTSLLGVPPMAALHAISKASGREFSWNTKRYVTRTFSVSIVAALCGVALYHAFLLLGATTGGALFLAIVFFFGTQMFSVSTVFLSYAPAMCFALLSYALILKYREALTPRILIVAGLALGGSLLCEYTMGIVAVGLSVYAFVHLKQRWRIVLYWGGCAIPLAVFAAYTLACFGEVAIPYKYLVRQEFKDGMSQGFQGIVGFNPAVLYYITVHRYRGLFYHSPILALAIWGWIAMLRDERRRSDALLSIAMVLGYLAFNSSYYMWWGGWTNGPRHLIPALPFLVVPLVWVWKSGKVARGLLIVLAAVSIFWNTLPAMVDAQIPQNEQPRDLYNPRFIHGAAYEDPLWELGVKPLLNGHTAVNFGTDMGLRGLSSLVPLALVWIGFALAVVRSVRKTKLESGAVP